MSGADLPAPLTPADCDLRGLEYMPLLGGRLFGSDFNSTANDSAWRAGVTLWWQAWNQVPAGSLPDDDAALCRLAELGKDLRTWRKLKAEALHGWIKCSDGRLYSRTLAEQALIAWDKRQIERKARSGEVERKARERADRSRMFEALQAVGVTPDWNIKTGELRELFTRTAGGNPPDVTPPVTVTVTAKTGRDGTGHKKEDVDVDAGAKPEPIPDNAHDLTDAVCRAIGLRHCDPGHILQRVPIVAEWLKAGADPPMVLAVAAERVAAITEPIRSLNHLDAHVRKAIISKDKPDGHANHGNDRRMGGGDKPQYRRNPAMDMLRDAIGGGLDGFAGTAEADPGAPGGDRGTWAALPAR